MAKFSESLTPLIVREFDGSIKDEIREFAKRRPFFSYLRNDTTIFAVTLTQIVALELR
jgi:hypothetical protein